MKSYFRQILILSAFLIVGGQLIGCASKKAVERKESSHVASIVRDTLRDSVYIYNNVHVRDSVIILQQGDTILKEKWKVVTEYQDRWRDRWRTQLVHDTIIKRDSIYIEKRPSKLQQLRNGIGNIAIVIISVIIFIAIIRYIRVT
jgi:hypothetical protein